MFVKFLTLMILFNISFQAKQSYTDNNNLDTEFSLENLIDEKLNNMNELDVESLLNNSFNEENESVESEPKQEKKTYNDSSSTNQTDVNLSNLISSLSKEKPKDSFIKHVERYKVDNGSSNNSSNTESSSQSNALNILNSAHSKNPSNLEKMSKVDFYLKLKGTNINKRKSKSCFYLSFISMSKPNSKRTLRNNFTSNENSYSSKFK